MPAASLGGGRRAVTLTKAANMSNNNMPDSDHVPAGAEKFRGVFVPAAVVMSKALPDNAKLVYGLVKGLCRHGGTCQAGNKRLAELCGGAASTVSRALARLQDAGLVKITSGKGGRRELECVGQAMPETQGGVPNRQDPVPNQQGDLIGISIDKKIEEEVGRFPSEKTETCEGRGGAMGIAEVFRDWCGQVLSMMGVRDWEGRDYAAGSVKKYRLGIPEPVLPTTDDVRRFEALALGFWPGTDAVAAARRLLRSCSQGRGQREFIQQHACAYRNRRLSLATLMAMGRKGDEGRFLAEAATVSEPVALVPHGAQGLAQVLSIMSYVGTGTMVWEKDFGHWDSCFLEAAYRCNDYMVDPSEYAACAYGIYETKGRDVPLPWIMSELQKTDLEAFAKDYARDRMRAWRGGPMRRDPDPKYLGDVGFYSGYCGRVVAQAAADGVTAFRSRQCLMCAAMELARMPGLASAVTGWKGTTEVLVDRLRDLYESVAEDVPPNRGEACGQKIMSSMPSLKRCRYGNATGLYVPGFGQVCQ